ncbi:MAG: hypothetical protein EHM24_33980 [Acidobacteria bacterium]|nr:MAG: hypothetical protein EHM24_33980 [Acidobacteriota bacterium]
MSSYEGHRDRDGRPIVTVDGVPLVIEGVHSPHVDWGYEGTAPAELTRALLRHHLEGRIPHPFIYHRVMRTLVRTLDRVAWTVTSPQLEGALKQALRACDRGCPLCADCGYRQIPGNREDACECAIGRRLFNAPQAKKAGR